MNYNNNEQANIAKSAFTVTYEEHVRQCAQLETMWKQFEDDLLAKKLEASQYYPRLLALTRECDRLAALRINYVRLRDVDTIVDMYIQSWCDTLIYLGQALDDELPDLSNLPRFSSLTAGLEYCRQAFLVLIGDNSSLPVVEEIAFQALYDDQFPERWNAQSGRNDDVLRDDEKDLRSQNRRKTTRPRGPPPSKIDSLYKELKRKVKHTNKAMWQAQSGMFGNLLNLTLNLSDPDRIRADRLLDTLQETNGLARGVSVDALKDVGRKFGSDVGKGFTKGAVNSSLDMVRQALLDFTSGHDKEAAVFLAAVVIYHMWCMDISRSAFTAGIVTVGVFLKSYGCETVFQGVFDAVMEVKDSVFRAQALSKSMIMEYVSCGLASFLLPSIAFKPHEALRNFQGFTGKAEGFTDALLAIVNFIQHILNLAAEKFGWSSFSMIVSTIEEVDSWASSSRDFLKAYGAGERPVTRETYDEIQRLLDQSLDLQSKFGRNRDTAHVCTIIRSVSTMLQKISKEMEEYGVGSKKTRPVPLVILFTGESQIGKSEMIRPLMKALLAAVLPDHELARVMNDLDSLMYARVVENKYWDGYFGQPVLIMDEAHLVPRPLATAENANSELVRCANTFQYMLHMAGIEQKGRSFFRSSIIVATTNLPDAYEGAKDFVSYPEAVSNRFQFQVLVSVKDEYATPASLLRGDRRHYKLDMSKLPASGEFCWDVHNFTILERVVDGCAPTTVKYEPGSTTYTMREFLAVLIGKYKELQHKAEYISTNERNAYEIGLKLRETYVAQGGNIDVSEEALRSAYATALHTQEETLVKYFFDELEPIAGRDVATSYFSNSLQRILFESPDLYEVFAELMSKVDDVKNFALYVNEDEFLTLLRRIQIAFPTLSKMHDVPFMEEAKRTSVMLIPSLLLKKAREAVSKYLPANYQFWLKVIAGVGTLTTLWFVYKGFSEPKEEHETLESFQAQSDKSVWPIMDGVLKNYYTVTWPNFTAGLGFFVHENALCFNKHFLEAAKAAGVADKPFKCTAWVPSSDGTRYSFEVTPETYNRATSVGPDLLMVRLANVRRHKDLMSKIVEADLLMKKGKCDGLIVTQRSGRQVVQTSKLTLKNDFKYSGAMNGVYEIPVAFTYDVETQDGDCGSPIFLVDTTTRSQKFVGVHVAGNGRSGCCLLLCNQDFSEYNAQSDTYIASVINVENELPEHETGATSIEKIGTVSRGPGTSGISKIAKSRLFNAWGPAKKAIAQLHPFINEEGERVKPFSEALNRYNKPLLRYPEEEIEVVSSSLKAHLVKGLGGEKYTKISFEDAQLGMPGVDYHDSINRSTSAGYPFNLEARKGLPGKTRFYGTGPEITFEGPDMPLLVEEYEKALGMLMEGKRPSFIFADALKDETVSHAKAKTGHTRLFCPSPIVYQILWNVFFKQFFVAMMTNRGKLEAKVGINVYSDEWEMLFRDLTRFGENNITAGDFKSFDALQSAQILEAIGEIVISFFSDTEYNGVRRLLWKEVFDSRHIVGTGIYAWRQSLPSGHPATSLINCLFNSFIFRMAYYRIHDRDAACLRDFEKHVVLGVYGDDNIVGVSDVKKEVFNQHTLTDTFSTMGLHFTAEDKSSDPPPLRNIHQVEFLKRRFRWEELLGRHCAPLRLDSVLEMPYWTKKDSKDPITQTNVENSIKELALHEPKVFEQWAPQILDASMTRLGYLPAITSRNVLVMESAKRPNPYA